MAELSSTSACAMKRCFSIAFPEYSFAHATAACRHRPEMGLGTMRLTCSAPRRRGPLGLLLPHLPRRRGLIRLRCAESNPRRGVAGLFPATCAPQGARRGICTRTLSIVGRRKHLKRVPLLDIPQFPLRTRGLNANVSGAPAAT